MFDIKKIRKDFPIFKNHNSLFYFDNASTTQKPSSVIEKITEFYTLYNANVHRGTYNIASKATLEYEQSRIEIAKFLNCNSKEIIFTKNTTESINLVANSLSNNILKEGDEILLSEMEHHSNIIPWQLISKKNKINIKYIPLLKSGELDIEKLDSLITNKTKLISISHMSNLLGTINPINQIISFVKQKNILVMIDAAQSVSHLKIDLQKINCDFLVFSGHKMLAPTGVGVLYGKENLLNKMSPFLGGGQMIKEVTLDKSTWGEIPYKFEAGTPNIASVLGLKEAVKYFNKKFNNQSSEYLHELSEYFYNKINKIKNIRILSIKKSPIVSFNIDGIHPFDLTHLLSTYNICIRSGHHCAQPILNKHNLKSINRASLYYYNTKEEVDFFCEKLNEVINILK